MKIVKKIIKIATWTCFIGLGLIFLVIASGIAYPHPLFTSGIRLGVLFILGSLVLFAVSWISAFTNAVKEKKWGRIAITLITVLFVFYSFFRAYIE